MKIIKGFATGVFLLLIMLESSCAANNVEIDYKKAINIAHDHAITKKYNPQQSDVEIIKVKSGVERGPIRFVWLMKYFSNEDVQQLLNKEFWIVYFYPKGLLDGDPALGGGFCTIVDLHSGHVLFSFQDF